MLISGEMFHDYFHVKQHFTTRGRHIVSIKAQEEEESGEEEEEEEEVNDRIRCWDGLSSLTTQTWSWSRIMTALYFCSSGCQL